MANLVPTNPDIRFSRAEDKAKASKDYVLDSVRIKKAKANLHAKAELGWWSKTFGTQLNTAKSLKTLTGVQTVAAFITAPIF